MPKLKTHRGAAKRFKITAGGKVKINHAKRRHILTKKTHVVHESKDRDPDHGPKMSM